MKTFNIWKWDSKDHRPTGNWLFMSAVLAKDDIFAMKIAQQRYGSVGKYKIYDGL